MEEKTQVSEVGFEPGTFRSCVGHSTHYATETPPIPDVLLVLVAPKHINRNVTTTLQSRFTPTPTPQATHSSFIILFYYYYFILFIYLFIYFFFFIFFFFVKLLNTPHSSPPPSSLSPPQPALFTRHHLPYLHPNPHSSPPTIFPISTPTRTLHRHHLPYLHPNPHSSPATIFPISTPTRTVRRPSPSQPALFTDHFRFRSLPVPTSYSSPTRY